MRKLLTLSLMALLAGAGGASLAKDGNVKEPLEEKDARIIVKFKSSVEDKSASEVLAYQNKALDLIRYNVTKNFDLETRYTNILNGVVLNVPSSKVNAIRNLSFVSDVNYDNAHIDDGATEARTFSFKTATRSTPGPRNENVSKRTMNVPSTSNEGEGILIGILDSGFLLNHYDKDTDKTYTHETFTDLDPSVKTKISSEAELKALVDADTKFHGKYDSTHSTYFNHKVPFYYDYGGYVAKGAESGTEDYDVYSPYSDHGLHVASMAAGNGSYYKGIAPKAQLALFKVFSETADGGSTCYNSDILEAVEDSLSLGCDVINLSLGTDLIDSEEDSILATTLGTLEAKGTFVNIAAGNSGKGQYSESGAYSAWTTELVETGIMSTLQNIENSMAIAASQPDALYYDCMINYNAEDIPASDQVDAHPLADLLKTGGPTFNWVRVPNLGANDDYAGIDATGKIAFVLRGDLTFADKVKNAAAHGAIAVGIINNEDGEFGINWGSYKSDIPVIVLTKKYNSIFDTNGSLEISGGGMYDNPQKLEMANFTSDGPTYDLRLKPNIATPGHQTLGAVCNKDDKLDFKLTDTYDFYSGTSMATPNYTGCVAILLGEHTSLVDGKLKVDVDFAKSMNARAMSTATQQKDKYGVTSSPRIQGAGMVNVQSALDTEVYLEQVQGSQRAKIELGNGENIAKGQIDLSFYATNLGSASKNYTATVKVYRPSIVEVDVEGHTVKKELQSITNTEIGSFTQAVTIPTGTNKITLDSFTISDEAKTYIEAHFEYACALEGYVVLEAVGEETLSIPFLGYYGDVSSANPIEPFKFERDPNKVYGSDLVNDLCHLESVGLTNADFSSRIAVGAYKRDTSLNNFKLDEFYLNQKALVGGIKDEYGNALRDMPVVKNNDGTYTLYTSNNKNNANSMIITQFVNRSVSTNYLTITKKSSGKVILTDHMFDSMIGGEDDYALCKSHVMIDYLLSSPTFVAHRAYTIIPFMDMSSGKEFADGEYELYFNYTTTDGATFEKKYDFIIDSDGPLVTSYALNDTNFVVNYKEDHLNKVVAGSSAASLNGNTATIKTSSAKNNRLLFTASDLSNNKTNSLVHLNDQLLIMVNHKDLTESYDFTSEVKEKNGIRNITLTIMQSASKEANFSNFYISCLVPEGFDASKIEVYNYNKNGERSLNNTTFIKDGVITFKSITSHFALLDTSKASADDIDKEEKKGCGGNIVTTSVIISSIALAGALLLVFRKRKED